MRTVQPSPTSPAVRHCSTALIALSLANLGAVTQGAVACTTYVVVGPGSHRSTQPTTNEPSGWRRFGQYRRARGRCRPGHRVVSRTAAAPSSQEYGGSPARRGGVARVLDFTATSGNFSFTVVSRSVGTTRTTIATTARTVRIRSRRRCAPAAGPRTRAGANCRAAPCSTRRGCSSPRLHRVGCATSIPTSRCEEHLWSRAVPSACRSWRAGHRHQSRQRRRYRRSAVRRPAVAEVQDGANERR